MEGIAADVLRLLANSSDGLMRLHRNVMVPKGRNRGHRCS